MSQKKHSGDGKHFSEMPIDKLMDTLEQVGRLNFEEIAQKMNWSIDSVEKLGLILEKRGIVEVHYPTIITHKPWITFEQKLKHKKKYKIEGTKFESYEFSLDSVPVKVDLIKVPNQSRPIYVLKTPPIGPYTAAFLDELKEEIANKIPVELGELTDEKKSKGLKQRFFKVTRKELKNYLDALAGLLLHGMYGLGKLEPLMSDNLLEEITVNSSRTPVNVYHRKHGWLETNVHMDNEEEIYNYASQIARKVGRQITTLDPILDAHLLSGDRVNATLAPITSFGNTITIRRFARRPWTVIDFIGKSHTLSLEMASLLWMGIQYEFNIIIAGGTASGKTSTLNALAAFMPNYHRILSIEDTRELLLPQHLTNNWVAMTTRNPNPEGQGEVTMLDLMHSSLRMRPDRIILGEMRRKKEADVLFEAMHTGHSVYSTLHANTSIQVLRRLTESPMSIPPLEVEAIDFVLIQHRDRKRNVRRTLELAELETGVSDQNLTVNTVYRWQPRDDSWENINPATKFVRTINQHTGMTEEEIAQELQDRAEILDWMLKNNLNDIDQVGQIMSAFYSDPDKVKKAAKENRSPKEFLEV
jgi:archaeal flagellar protein FlaI